MLTAMQMEYFKKDFNTVLLKVVEREHIMEIDASCTATTIMSDPMRISFTFDAILQKNNIKGGNL